MTDPRRLNTKAESRRARARYLAQSMQLEEADVPGVVRLGVFAVAFLTAGSLAWAAVTPVEELAKTEGQVVPAGRNQLVQHLEGGMVSEILVADGDRVSQGDVLLRLASERADSEAKQVGVRRAALRLELERLQALDEDREPSFDSTVEHYPKLALRQRALFDAERSSRDSQLAVVSARIGQKRAELDRHTRRGTALKRQHELLREQLDMLGRLHKKGSLPRAEILSLGAQVAEAESDYLEVDGSIAVTRSAIAQAERERTEIEEGLRRKVREGIADISAELAEVEQNLARLIARRERLAVKAPAAGIVKGVSVNTLNEVVQPGAVLMEIVPVSDRMIVETRISPQDIAHVSVGDGAHVAVDSFDVSRFGTIPGEVRHVSASTYLDANNAAYYRVELALERSYVGDHEGNALLPGMTVNASIVTGSKSVLDYVLKPVYRGFRNALHER